MNKKTENPIFNIDSLSLDKQKQESNNSKLSPSRERIKYGKVILIPNETTVLIDLGWDILSVNSKIKVFEVLTNITNLNGDIIGEYKFVKATLTVVEVQKNFSICKNLVKKKSSINLIISSNSEHDFEYAKILVNEEQNLNLTPENPFISLGDPVEIV